MQPPQGWQQPQPAAPAWTPQAPQVPPAQPAAPAWAQQPPQAPAQQPQVPQAPQAWQQPPQFGAPQPPQFGAQQPPQFGAPQPPQFGAPPAGYAPQGFQQPGPAGYPPQGYPQGYAPATKSKAPLIAGIAIGAVALIVVLLAAVVLISGGSSYPGSITFSPSTYSCGSGGDVTLTITLPSSLAATDTVTMYTDGGDATPLPVGATFTKQSNGTWQFTFAGSGASGCGTTGSSSLGSHTVTIKDTSGKILAEGHYTINP
jgi:hypothetical protein